MKTKFATIDLCAVIHDLKELISMRVINVYDINSKTYLIKLQKPNDKAFILFESGIRIHRTSYDWPKAVLPSSFSMKFRKHINQKRLISVLQHEIKNYCKVSMLVLNTIDKVGMDRIIDLQFGEKDRSCHVIVELYDRGNVILTDANYVILNVLRPRTDADNDVRFLVKEKYPMEYARKETYLPSLENIQLFLENAKAGEPLKRSLVRHVPFGSLMLDHVLISVGLPANAQIDANLINNKELTIETSQKVFQALKMAEEIAEKIRKEPLGGFIAYTTNVLKGGQTLVSYQEYYPYDFCQFHLPDGKFSVMRFNSFSDAVDKFYSSIEAQKNEQRLANAEREMTKKLENVRRDHDQRLKALDDVQAIQEQRGEYVQCNRDLIEKALLLIRTALASKSNWAQIAEWIEQCAKAGVEAARSIVKLDLESNLMTMRLTNPYADEEDSDEMNGNIERSLSNEPINVEIDIGLSADQNVRKYFANRRMAMDKRQKTLAASTKALKSAQLQMNNKFSQVQVKTNAIRTRRMFWFEKFHWFISSDNFLVVAGRDAQQNELLVKRYIRPGDIYVHAEIQGAASVVVRNRLLQTPLCSDGSREVIVPPPRTLNEAGIMAICFSSAWEAKVVISAWWVYHDQVSRTAPTGEFLPAGSFMIRGKKNFLPTSQLQLGFGLLFKLDEESFLRHKALKLAKESDELSSTGLTTINEGVIVEVGKEGPLDCDVNEDEMKIKEDCNKDLTTESASATLIDEFPDVNVNLKSLRGSTQQDEDNSEFSVINFAPVPKPKTETAKYLEEKAKLEQLQTQKKGKDSAAKDGCRGVLTLRQKHKLEKIRKKYKDQDEEEREIRLKLLGSAGKNSHATNKTRVDVKDLPSIKEINTKKEKGEDECQGSRAKDEAVVESNDADGVLPEEKVREVEEIDGEKTDGDVNETSENQQKEKAANEEEEDEEDRAGNESDIIDSLCASLAAEDAPLFVVGTCGPYSAMQKYKYKVKITPGTGKRGKAFKMAMQLFLRDKNISTAEQLLLKNLAADDRVAACLPGKLRVSAPMLMNVKAKN